MTNIEKIINDAWEKRDQINQKSDKNIIDAINMFIKNLNSFKKNIKNLEDKNLRKKLINSKKVRKQIINLKQDIAKPDFGRE